MVAPTSFREATRLNSVSLAASAVQDVGGSASGQSAKIVLPQTGFMGRVILRIALTMTLGAGSPALTGRGAAAIIRRIRLYSNQGGDVHSLSGWGARIAEATRRFYRDPWNVMTTQSYSTSIFNAPIVAGGANSWVMELEIPAVVNERDEIGLLLLQNEEARFTVEVEIGNGSDAVSGVTAAVSAVTVTPVLEYYTVPYAQELWPRNLRLVYQLLEDRIAVLGAGTPTPYTVPRGAILRKLLATVQLNAALNSAIADVTQFELVYNQNEVPMRGIPSWWVQRRMRQQYGNDLPVGLWALDWTDSLGFVGLGDYRDLIVTPNVSDLELRISIASGATLGANNNFIDVIRDQISQLT